MSEPLRVPTGSRVACVGRTGTGKSLLARALFLAAGGRRLVLDPFDSELTDGPWPTTSSARPDWSRSDTWRVVPDAPDDLAFADELYSGAFELGELTLWTDEASAVTRSNQLPPGVARVLFQGRKRRIRHIACTQRPAGVNPALWAQSELWAIFALPWGRDRETVAASAGIPAPIFEEHMSRLSEHGFVWWDQRANELTIVADGLPRELVAEISKKDLAGS